MPVVRQRGSLSHTHGHAFFQVIFVADRFLQLGVELLTPFSHVATNQFRSSASQSSTRRTGVAAVLFSFFRLRTPRVHGGCRQKLRNHAHCGHVYRYLAR